MSRFASPRRTAALSGLLLISAVVAGWVLKTRIASDRATAIGLAEAFIAPRMILDPQTLENHYDRAVEEIAAARRDRPAAVRSALERFAAGSLPGFKRAGYDALLAQLAARRFEIAITSARDLAAAPQPELPSWRLLTLAAALELGRGRPIAAEPLFAQAFDLANKADQLDTPGAAGLLAGYGAVQLLRSQPAAAEPFLRRATSILTRSPGSDPRDRQQVLAQFAQAITAQGFPEEAAALR